jgi:hypothetical protein
MKQVYNQHITHIKSRKNLTCFDYCLWSSLGSINGCRRLKTVLFQCNNFKIIFVSHCIQMSALSWEAQQTEPRHSDTQAT